VDQPSTSHPLALTPLKIGGDWVVYGLQIITRSPTRRSVTSFHRDSVPPLLRRSRLEGVWITNNNAIDTQCFIIFIVMMPI
jgi:hypothetical protein